MVAVTRIYQEHAGEPPARAIAAAALRAAVDQVIPENGDMPLNMAHRLSWDARQQVRQQLLAIAAKLQFVQ